MSVLLDSAIAQIGKLHDGPDVVRLAREIGERFPRLKAYCATAGNGTPWCGIFIAWLLAQQGIAPPYDPNDAYGSFMWVDSWAKNNWGGTHIQKGQEQPGDIIPMNPPHHVTILKRVEGDRYICVGGNQTGPSGNPDSVTESSYARSSAMAIVRPPQAGQIITEPPDPHPEIMRGATGDPVRELQRLLGVTVNGVFGLDTDVAVRAYQADHGLDVDGEVGPLTWAALLGNAPATPLPTNTQTSKGSWYSQYDGKYHWRDTGDAPGSAALGVPDDAQGVAMPSRSVLGNWYAVRAPNGKVSIEQVTDLGPAAWTGRTIDIAAAAAERLGYSPQNFPTDSIFTFWPVPVPREVAGLSKQNQAIQYRDIRKGLPPAPPPIVIPPPPPVAPPIRLPQPQGSIMDDKIRLSLITEICRPAPNVKALQLQLLDSPPPVSVEVGGVVPPIVPVPPVVVVPPVPPTSIVTTGINATSTAALIASILGSLTGVIGAPIGPDQTTIGSLLPLLALAGGAFGIPSPIVNLISGLFGPKTKP